MAEAWKEYRETHIVDDQDGKLVVRNAVRPSQFFNLDDLHFTQGFWRIVPGLFVTIGLSLTFLGLISALNSMSTSLDDGGSAALEGLLTIASAKFIMSLTGLCCSIVFTIGLRSGTSQLEKTVHSLNSLIEKRLTFISLEDLSIRQLIEVDKRAGMSNAMSLQLSYSGDHFSVPANVDIIGAMNTADRSLVLMDTALRRRFDFVEMMPDLSLLSGAKVKGIELESLLEKLNSRIEALYDREHTLGHAFFIPVKNALDASDEETAFKQLKFAFQKKIVPLLQEYFFDDWNKIRLVLADNQKQDDNLQFVIEKTDDLDTLFGNNHALRRHGQQSTA